MFSGDWLVMSSIKRNYIYNTVYNILNMLIPLVTAPYLARMLGTEGVGTYAYYFSIAQYFVIFAKLGLADYGTRYLAVLRDDDEAFRDGFTNIFVMQLSVTLFVSITYGAFVYFIAAEKTMASIFGLWVAFTVFDTDWLLFALEDFKTAAFRNSIVKVASTILILIIVKNVGDLWKYATITTISYEAGYVFLFERCRTYISFKYVTPKKVISHIKPSLLLLVPILAMNIYRTMDKVMVGIFSGMDETGLYEYAEKFINCLMSFFASLGTVMLPRISNLLAHNKNDTVAKYISNSMCFFIFLGCGMCFGVSAIADSLIPILYGENFAGSIILLKLLAITLIFIAWGNVIRTQYVIPSKRDNIYIGSILTGALVNLIANLILIPRYDAVGACIGTILAEFSVVVFQFIRLHRDLPYLQYLKNTLPFVFFGIIMLIFCNLIEEILGLGVVTMILQVIFGFLLYCALSYFYLVRVMHFDVLRIFLRKKG